MASHIPKQQISVQDIALVLQESREPLSGKQIAQKLRSQGLVAQKTLVNRMLYKNRHRFTPDTSSGKALWSLTTPRQRIVIDNSHISRPNPYNNPTTTNYNPYYQPYTYGIPSPIPMNQILYQQNPQESMFVNYKGRLNELAHKSGDQYNMPQYTTTTYSDNGTVYFSASVSYRGMKHFGMPRLSKKEAEQNAALMCLIWNSSGSLYQHNTV